MRDFSPHQSIEDTCTQSQVMCSLKAQGQGHYALGVLGRALRAAEMHTVSVQQTGIHQ